MTALAPLEIPPGTDVRGFLIEGKLGAGGFGTVYRARRGERLYALKFIRIKEAGGWARREQGGECGVRPMKGTQPE